MCAPLCPLVLFPADGLRGHLGPYVVGVIYYEQLKNKLASSYKQECIVSAGPIVYSTVPPHPPLTNPLMLT